jgi:hypothetical protein
MKNLSEANPCTNGAQRANAPIAKDGSMVCTRRWSFHTPRFFVNASLPPPDATMAGPLRALTTRCDDEDLALVGVTVQTG